MASPFGSLSPFDLSTFDPSTYAGVQPAAGNGPSFSDYATVITPAAQQGWLNSPRPEAPPNDSGGGTTLTPSNPGYASTDMPNSGPQSAVPDSSLIGRLRSLLSGNPGQAVSGLGDTAGNWIANNRNTLMALGAGMAGAQNLGQGLSRGMGAAIPAMQTDQRQQVVNQTAQFLMGKGYDQRTALAIASNPAVLQQMLPQLLGAKQGIVVNNRLVDPATGKVIADFSDTALKAPETHEFSDPTTGEKYQTQWNPQTQRWERLNPQSMPLAAGQAAAGAAVPASMAGRPPSEQLKSAPDGSVVRIGTARYIKQSGRWVPFQ